MRNDPLLLAYNGLSDVTGVLWQVGAAWQEPHVFARGLLQVRTNGSLGSCRLLPAVVLCVLAKLWLFSISNFS